METKTKEQVKYTDEKKRYTYVIKDDDTVYPDGWDKEGKYY